MRLNFTSKGVVSCSSLPPPPPLLLHDGVFRVETLQPIDRQTFEMLSLSQLLSDAVFQEQADSRPGHNATNSWRGTREEKIGGNPFAGKSDSLCL